MALRGGQARTSDGLELGQSSQRPDPQKLDTARGDKLYIGGSEQDFRLQKEFPYSKAWWANIERDPRVRIKIDGEIYEMTVALVADRAEVFQLIGRNPVTKEIGADGKEQITGVRHYWRVYQRNIPEYGDGS